MYWKSVCLALQNSLKNIIRTSEGYTEMSGQFDFGLHLIYGSIKVLPSFRVR